VSDDVRRRLDDAARRPVAGPDPAFGDALEARLVAVAGSIPPPPAPGQPSQRRRPSLLRVAAGATVLAAGVLVLALTVGHGRPATNPELVAPVNVEVSLADGTTLEDPDGLRLPDGATVTVGDGGSAQIGDLVLEPGDVARVVDGRLQVERLASPPPAAVRTPARTPSATHGERATPTPSPAPTPGRTAAPTPAPTPTPATPEPTAAGPTPTAPPTPAPTFRRPRLRARAIETSTGATRVAVIWAAAEGADSYVLLVTGSRTGPAADPVYPGSRELGTFARPPDKRLRFRVPDGVTEVRLLVVALRPDGSVLARSRIVTVATGVAAAAS
jgi:hypothetical protein